METVYSIKKTMSKKGKIIKVLMIDSQGEVLEINTKEAAEDFINILNSNTDNGCFYETIEILKK